MFVRWKRRAELKRRYGRFKRGRPGYQIWGAWESEPTGAWIKTAYLIKSVRTPSGPRHEYVCRLGSFREGREGDPEEQAEFWWRAELKLASGHISPAERQQIIANLEAVIPQPVA